ncbi:Gamma-glutamyl cyclotransferase, AIG2-like [Neorhodopirellula lusitana]|uniref:Gamma-glutamyl cyclotransferase, AIG2-like n=1 Tax=Neorhodopirellula lusitana TaxID=445327 RepID=A0ABY1QR00_9BACT|nr:gamma-glutamylcyclotransferase family protein [Neorhodopirellula lusitana]SMP76547.1 Gamma-glutamyl cyclotransferase, AIG2-like [Neorhodopirellula lusitana]
MNESIKAFFVYGTLCRGQCREHLWPARPIRIVEAWTYGTLYGRADYPAMRSGTDKVAGEYWSFDPKDMSRVIAALDEIEGTHQVGQPNLYDRVIIDVYKRTNEEAHAMLEPNPTNKPTLESLDKKPLDDLTIDDTPPNRSPFDRAYGYHYAIDPIADGFQQISKSVRQTSPCVKWPTE